MVYYAVIDTNVFISALLSKRTDAATVKVLEAIFDGTIVPLYHKDILGTNPNFNTNAPPFKVRGCKVISGGAFLSQGVQPHLIIHRLKNRSSIFDDH